MPLVTAWVGGWPVRAAGSGLTGSPHARTVSAMGPPTASKMRSPALILEECFEPEQ